MNVRVTDYDENENPQGADSVTVTVRNLRTGETEAVALYETTDTSGVFVIQLPLLLSGSIGDNVDNDTLYVLYGDSLMATYLDGSDTAWDTALVVPRSSLATLYFSDAAQGAVATYTVHTRLYVTVSDTDRNRYGFAAESLAVFVRISATGDSELLTLTETGQNSGIFSNVTGVVLRDTGAAVVGDGWLFLGVGDTAYGQYADQFTVTDTAWDTATLAFVQQPSAISALDENGAVTTRYEVGDTAYPRVIDNDANELLAVAD